MLERTWARAIDTRRGLECLEFKRSKEVDILLVFEGH